MFGRCALAGLAWGVVGAAGQFLERGLIDKAVASPERLIFEGGPIVEPPLAQAPRPARAQEGDILDTLAACPPLNPSEREAVSQFWRDERARVKPEAEKARAAWCETHIKRLVSAGKTTAEAKAIADRWLDTQELSGDFPLPFDDPKLACATVAEVLANPARYAGKTLADPIEGPAYGRGKARLFKNGDGSLVVNSFAHGGAVYQLKAETEGAGLEDSVALKFADTHAGDLRYIAKTSKWLMWRERETRWIVEDTLAAFDLARALCREAGDARAKIVAAVERLARSDRRIAATLEQWDNDSLLLGTPKGVVDLKTGELRPARREDFITKSTAVAPEDGGAPPDLWLKFLDRVFNNNDALIAFVQRFCGYCLTGEVSEHVFAFLFGTGRNGKGVFCSVIAYILGDYATTSPVELFLESAHERHPVDEARLHKARLTIAQEIPTGRVWNAAKIKNLTGGDKVVARFMRQDTIEFKPTHKLIIAGNAKPKLNVVDEAMHSRLKLIPFTVTIPPADRDPQLSDKLKHEAPQILRWMIDGCIAWQKEGLGEPEAVRDASDDYFHDQDAFAHWLDDCCERRQLAFTESAVLFASWKAWANERGFDVGSERAFAFALVERGWTHKRTKKARGFKDLVLKTPPDTAANEGTGDAS